MTPETKESGSASKAPKALTYIRILMLVEITRFAGLLFLVTPSETIPAYFTTPFGLGDVLTAITAIILVVMLGRGGARTYAMTFAWSIFGLADGLLGIGVASLGGLLPAVTQATGVMFYILPIDLLIHVVVIFVLLTKSVSQYMTQK